MKALLSEQNGPTTQRVSSNQIQSMELDNFQKLPKSAADAPSQRCFTRTAFLGAAFPLASYSGLPRTLPGSYLVFVKGWNSFTVFDLAF